MEILWKNVFRTCGINLTQDRTGSTPGWVRLFKTFILLFFYAFNYHISHQSRTHPISQYYWICQKRGVRALGTQWHWNLTVVLVVLSKGPYYRIRIFHRYIFQLTIAFLLNWVFRLCRQLWSSVVVHQRNPHVRRKCFICWVGSHLWNGDTSKTS